MTTAEAIMSAMEHGMWCRPNSWAGSGRAIMPDNARLLSVPASFSWEYVANVSDLTQGWHVVDPDDVIYERAKF